MKTNDYLFQSFCVSTKGGTGLNRSIWSKSEPVYQSATHQWHSDEFKGKSISDNHPEYGINHKTDFEGYGGILKNRIILVDCDGTESAFVVNEACKFFGINPPKHKSQNGGGMHFFFRLPQTHHITEGSKKIVPLGYFDGDHEGIDFKIGRPKDSTTKSGCCFLARPQNDELNRAEWVANWEGGEILKAEDLPELPRWLYELNGGTNIYFSPKEGLNNENCMALNREINAMSWNVDIKRQCYEDVLKFYNHLYWKDKELVRNYNPDELPKDFKRGGRKKKESRDLSFLNADALVFMRQSDGTAKYYTYDPHKNTIKICDKDARKSPLETYFFDDLLEVGEDTSLTKDEEMLIHKRIREFESPQSEIMYFKDGELNLATGEFKPCTISAVQFPLNYLYSENTDKQFEDFTLSKYYKKSNFDKWAMWLSAIYMNYNFKRNICMCVGDSNTGKTYITEQLGKYVMPSGTSLDVSCVWHKYYMGDKDNAYKLTIVSDIPDHIGTNVNVQMDKLLRLNERVKVEVKGDVTTLEPHGYLCTSNKVGWFGGSEKIDTKALLNRIFQFTFETTDELPEDTGWFGLPMSVRNKINEEWDEFGCWMRQQVIEICSRADEIDFEYELVNMGDNLCKVPHTLRETLFCELLDVFSDDLLGQVERSMMIETINGLMKTRKNATQFGGTIKIGDVAKKFGYEFKRDDKRSRFSLRDEDTGRKGWYLTKDGKMLSDKRMTYSEFKNLLIDEGVIEE